MDQLETKFRSILRSLQSLPPSTVSAAVYLMSGVPPVVAERDIQIMRLTGQLAICARDLQNVSAILEENLSKYGIKFSGWSGLARRTAALYGLYMLYMVSLIPSSFSNNRGLLKDLANMPKK